MSIQYLNAAWGTVTSTPTEKLVLMSLADQANAHGVCWPSIQHIAKRTQVSERQVIRVLKALEEAGIVSVESRPGDGEGRKTNVYTLHLGQSDTVSLRGGQSDICAGQSDMVSPKPSLEPSFTAAAALAREVNPKLTDQQIKVALLKFMEHPNSKRHPQRLMWIRWVQTELPEKANGAKRESAVQARERRNREAFERAT